MNNELKEYIGKYIRVSKMENDGFANIYKITDVNIKHSIFPYIAFTLTNVFNKETFDVPTGKLESYTYVSEKEVNELEEYIKSRSKYGR